MSDDNSSGWNNIQRYLGVILATLALLGIVAGSVHQWSWINYQMDDACVRIERLEARQETQASDSLRVERKVDRLLIEQGINPDSIR